MDSATETNVLRVDVWSDVVCPWCFLGKRRFERAVSELNTSVAVEVRWRAFQLDPRATSTPTDLRRAIEGKYGPGAFDGMVAQLTELGRPEGIDYRFDLAQRVSTADAHRLVAWSHDVGGSAKQGELVEALFRAYFEQGRNVANREVLVEIAVEVGLDGGTADDVLGSDRYWAEVSGDQESARQRDISAVPGFLVEDRLLIPGAQEADTFKQILSRAASRFS